MDDLIEKIKRLHNTVTLKIDFEITPRGRIKWTKTVCGEDFLDGPWVFTYTGTARNLKIARRRAMKAWIK